MVKSKGIQGVNGCLVAFKAQGLDRKIDYQVQVPNLVKRPGHMCIRIWEGARIETDFDAMI